MNESTSPESIASALKLLLAAGARPDEKDSDGDTALQAVIALANDIDDVAGPEGESDEDPKVVMEIARQAHQSALVTLLECPHTSVSRKEAVDVCQYLRRHCPEYAEKADKPVLKVLAGRLGQVEVDKMWCSEMMMGYLEECAYEGKQALTTVKVQDFIDRGASPSHSQNGASALLLAVLNPYTSYEELRDIFRILLSADPSVAGMRDGFKLTPVQWAADYQNIADQHGLKQPNPGVLLALMPNLVALLPADVDGGERCIKVSKTGYCMDAPASGSSAQPPRFMEGDRVICRLEVPGGAFEWEEGVVVGLWYRDMYWPQSFPGAPYKVRLDLSGEVFALVDHDRIVRKETARKPPSSKPPEAAKDESKPAAKRFQKRQKEDGSWEMLDTISGKSRACPTPDSDDSDIC